MPFAYVAAAAAVIGAATSAYGAYEQGQQAQAADQYNQEVAQQNAIAATQQAQQNALLQQQQAAKTIGAEIAGYGSSGIDSGSGSALDEIGNSAANATLDNQTILYKGQLQAIGYTDESQLDAAKASNDATSGDLKAASSLITGAANAYSKIPGSTGSNTPGSSDNLSGNGSDSNISGGTNISGAQ